MLTAISLEEYLTTRELAEGWYLLAGKDITILVDTIKLRIFRVFAYGRLGTLQQLCYETDSHEMSRGNWGIVPYFFIGKEKFYPFSHDIDFFRYDNKPGIIDFYPEENRIVIDDIIYRSDGFKENRVAIPGGGMDIRVDGRDIIIKLKYPASAHRTGLHTGLYPLYDSFISNGRNGDIFYQYGLDLIGPHEIELFDSKCRMPGLILESKYQSLHLTAGKDKDRGEAFNLNVDFEGWTIEDEICITVSDNPVSAEMPQLCNADEPFTFKIYSKNESMPVCMIDNKSIELHEIKKGTFEGEAKVNEGEHDCVVSNVDGKSFRNFWAVGNWKNKVTCVGEGLYNALWQNEPIKGIFPHAYRVKDGRPCLDGEQMGNLAEKEFSISYIEYGPRVVYSLIASSIITGDRKYIDSAKTGLEKIRNMSISKEDGGRIVIPQLWNNGKINEHVQHPIRPATFGIIIGALVACAKGYRFFKDIEAESKCLDWASEYAKILVGLQEENGCFFERFIYPDMQICSRNVYGATVCAWPFWIWELALAIEKTNEILSESLKRMCRKSVEFLMTLEPGLLRVAGTEGGHMNSMESLFPASVLCALNFLFTGEACYKKYAEDLYIKALLTNCMYIDQPHNYLYPCCWWHSIYFVEKADYPGGLLGKGGMFDLSMAECSIALLKYIDFALAGKVMRNVLGCRLATSIFSNGIVCSQEVSLPNFYYKNEIVAEDCEFGGIGLSGLYLSLLEQGFDF